MELSMRVLVTGGAGYIGSHVVLELLVRGHDVLVIDNLCNSSAESLARVAVLSGRSAEFVEGDIRNQSLVRQALTDFGVETVMHFAGLKAVGESVADPLRYYDNNVWGSVSLLQAMGETGVRQFIFSSSATVYGDPQFLPYTEQHPLAAINPYGRSKLMVEEVLRDLGASDDAWRIAILRYFNPVGAHESGEIGEDPRGIPNNLMPFIAQVAVGRRSRLQIFGNDYPTPDGTGVRDYIHVVDLAVGHVKAAEALQRQNGVMTFNLGTGHGVSVLEMVHAFEEANGCSIPYDIVPRRPGDLAAYYAAPGLAAACLGWKAERNILDMCRDSWNWQRKNPLGYGE